MYYNPLDSTRVYCSPNESKEYLHWTQGGPPSSGDGPHRQSASARLSRPHTPYLSAPNQLTSQGGDYSPVRHHQHPNVIQTLLPAHHLTQDYLFPPPDYPMAKFGRSLYRFVGFKFRVSGPSWLAFHISHSLTVQG